MRCFDERPWGRWEEYLDESGYRLKRLIILPGCRLSLQKHNKRNEHWIVVRGLGTAIIGSEEFRLSPGATHFVPIGAIHRLQSDEGAEPLEIIEVQTGVCDEDDIVRIEDDWGRT